ncbi:DUF523 and DUF1722 domain-containing protein [Mechercharimyces sp. CAU 1602]|uniref:YbgA family protein n=1 Tax=Mechercharimyces sp. CAU 1602 TaxID=2973933 RepID=UPI0021615DE8|nr:DUF523 and DUF1722 domain-containing protein [Mechercharimyces sp. CAU 1602]MCS1351813.1 DUF523 and DUF1722 domain-containing protein [Mechercharimyces sp. CAU 1602]
MIPRPPMVKIAISSCLLGEKVRYDGRDKYNPRIVENLAPLFSFIPVCPEMKMGLGAPREPMNLVRPRDGRVELVTVKSKRNLTTLMQAVCEQTMPELARACVSGYIFKKGSPSCGIEGVPLYNEEGEKVDEGSGLFVHALRSFFPNMPIVEESDLGSIEVLISFAEQVVAYEEWAAIYADGFTPTRWGSFHSRYKMKLLAHSRPHLTKMGKLVAQGGGVGFEDRLQEYGQVLFAGLQVPATRKKHTDVLYHFYGHIKSIASTEERTAILSSIEAYRQEQESLRSPWLALKEVLQKYQVSWALKQSYLSPGPAALWFSKEGRGIVDR